MKKKILLGMIAILAVLALWKFTHSGQKPVLTSNAAFPPAAYSAGISLSVNHSLHTRIVRGWPVIVNVFLILPEGSTLPESIKNSWRRNVAVELRTEKGLQPADFQPMESNVVGGNPDDTAWNAQWLLSSESTQSLAPGNYQLKAVLKDKSQVISKSYFSRIEVLASSDEKLHAADEFYLKAEAFMLQKRYPEAESLADQFLKDHPKDIVMTGLKADLSSVQGRQEDALDLYDQLLDAYPSNEPPPESLIRKRHQLLAEILKPNNPETAKGK